MLSLFFYLLLALIFLAIGCLFFYQRKQGKKRSFKKVRQEPIINDGPGELTKKPEIKETKKSAYDPNVIVLQIQSFSDKPFMGYELLQTLLSVGLRFGAMNIFHRYESEKDSGNVQFSVAAATSDGGFPIDDMGAFECVGLVMFMKLNSKQGVMARFDLMLDVARQLVEELGGEIYDDLHQPINANVIRRLRERICAVETSNLYVADLLDNLD